MMSLMLCHGIMDMVEGVAAVASEGSVATEGVTSIDETAMNIEEMDRTVADPMVVGREEVMDREEEMVLEEVMDQEEVMDREEVMGLEKVVVIIDPPSESTADSCMCS